MKNLLKTISSDYKKFKFEPGDCFLWNPESSTIYYLEDEVAEQSGIWSLLHEVGHALLEHKSNRDDLDLLMMEVLAWSKAKEISSNYGLAIDESHIERCIESYRSWLHRRSRCIDCQTNSLQLNKTTYKCHNCGTSWKVSESVVCKIRKRRINLSARNTASA